MFGNIHQVSTKLDQEALNHLKKINGSRIDNTIKPIRSYPIYNELKKDHNKSSNPILLPIAIPATIRLLSFKIKTKATTSDNNQ